MEDNTTIEERQEKDKQNLLAILKEMPIVQIACKKAGISRATYYRWRKEDKNFLQQSEEAMAEGVDFINDLSEGQLVNLIREKSWPALAFWLRKRNPKFLDRIEVITKEEDEELTPEEEKVVREALQLGSAITNNNQNENENTNNITPTDRNDDQEQKDTNSNH